MSAEWLSSVLGTEIADLCVETVGVGSGFAGSIYRIHLTPHASDSGGDVPATLIWKTVSSHPSTHTLLTQLGIYRAEADFYTNLARRARIAPRAYYSYFDAESGSICLLLEDLSQMDAGDQIEGCTPEQARQVVTALAGLHAEFWDERGADATLGVRRFDSRASASMGVHSESWRRVRKSAITIPPGLSDAADMIAPHVASVKERLGSAPTTLLHGDVRADNAFFDSDGVKLIDWQAVRVGRGAYDLAYFLSTSLSEETRRTYQDDLTESYVETLASHGVEEYCISDCLEDIRWALLDVVTFVGMIGAALDFSEGRGLQLANLVMSRLWASLEDNRAVELLDRASTEA
jgi:fructosamine-3-kinase